MAFPNQSGAANINGVKGKRSIFATQPDAIGNQTPGIFPRSTPQQLPAQQITGGGKQRISAFAGGNMVPLGGGAGAGNKPPMPQKEKVAVAIKLRNQGSGATAPR